MRPGGLIDLRNTRLEPKRSVGEIRSIRELTPIVRAEVSRLRGRLERYYATEGRNDPIRIMLPRGSYVPEFVERNVSPTGASGHPDLPVKSQFRERVALAQYFHTI